MKHLITLMIALATFAGVQAQPSRIEARRTVLGAPRHSTVAYPQSRVVVVDRGYGYGYPPSYRERRMWEERRRRAAWYRRHHDHGHHYGWYR